MTSLLPILCIYDVDETRSGWIRGIKLLPSTFPMHGGGFSTHIHGLLQTFFRLACGLGPGPMMFITLGIRRFYHGQATTRVLAVLSSKVSEFEHQSFLP